MARNPAAKPNPAKVAEQQAEAFKLKLDGATVREIATAMGLPKSTVQDRLDAAYDDLVLPLADEARQLELARLDRWQWKLEQRLDDGEDPVRVVPVAVKVSESRRKLMGTDAPEKVEATVSSVPVDDATAAVLAAARARSEARVAQLRNDHE